MGASLAALGFAFAMFWEILWALVLGFTLSAIVQAVVSKSQMSRLLPDDSPRSLAIACGLGAASSSCSYAAVALARSIFRKGANFTAAMAFEFASTNLVIELGIIMALLLGWQFTVAEFVGGPLMIILLWGLFRLFLRRRSVEEARRQAERGVAGSMEGHATMDMSVTEGALIERIFSRQGFTAISHYFVMDWGAIWRDIAGGLLLAGALAAWVPKEFWQRFFLIDHPVAAYFWGPVVGPIVAILSFVCSIGNVPLAAVLWNGGISFGGVISFIFADLIVLPILNIYRKYYGGRMTVFLLVSSYAAMVLAGLLVELGFMATGLVPRERAAVVVEPHITLNYTTVLNVVFLMLAGVLMVRFFRTNGLAMLRMMNQPEGGHGRHRDLTEHRPH
ncbi:MAG: hypothetical protein AUH81_16535 [Candidatus Rokubacteria bacterium 13_1_40CM_4_69_5]|nr:MAG: hypothetical protein AUH81_16535 [Candidatus Rokubacteria bacterium 13_1_40CM_4_69_5]